MFGLGLMISVKLFNGHDMPYRFRLVALVALILV